MFTILKSKKIDHKKTSLLWHESIFLKISRAKKNSITLVVKVFFQQVIIIKLLLKILKCKIIGDWNGWLVSWLSIHNVSDLFYIIIFSPPFL